MKTTNDQFGRIDILFNNAGIYIAKSVLDTTVEEWNKLMGVNVTGTFLGMKHVIPVMKEQKSGSIINASSIPGLTGSAHHALYGASKGAIRIMTKDVAMEVAEYNIRVNSTHPGIIGTTMGEAMAKDRKTTVEKIRLASPLKRTGTPEDIANMVLFLASDESSFITAKEMVVDGGQIH